MIKPKVSKYFLEQLQTIRPGLHLGWDEKVSRFFVAHKHEYTGQMRVIRYCENNDGSFRMPDMRDINYIRKYVDWDKIYKYPDVKDMFNAMVRENDEEKRKKLKQRNNWIESFMKDNKRMVKEAVRDLWENGYKPYIPKPKDKKIFVDQNANNYKQTNSGLLVPKFSKGE